MVKQIQTIEEAAKAVEDVCEQIGISNVDVKPDAAGKTVVVTLNHGSSEGDFNTLYSATTTLAVLTDPFEIVIRDCDRECNPVVGKTDKPTPTSFIPTPLPFGGWQ